MSNHTTANKCSIYGLAFFILNSHEKKSYFFTLLIIITSRY